MTLATRLDASVPRRPGVLLLYFGLLAPPLAWIVQENFGFGLGSHACFPFRHPTPDRQPFHEGAWTIMLAVNLALLAVAALGLVTSLIAWRRMRGRARQQQDSHDDVLAPGEGRLRVFAASGLLVAFVFIVAIGANTISLLTLSTCSLP